MNSIGALQAALLRVKRIPAYHRRVVCKKSSQPVRSRRLACRHDRKVDSDPLAEPAAAAFLFGAASAGDALGGG